MKRLKLILAVFTLMINFAGYSQFVEGFEGAPDAPTNGQWTIGTHQWAVFETGTGSPGSKMWGINWRGTLSPAYTGDDAAYVESENVASGKALDWLVTPAINLSQFTNPSLSFFSRLTTVGDQGSIYKIYISTTSQTDVSTFQLLQQWTETEINAVMQTQYQYNSIAIPATYANSTTAYIAFVLETDSGDRWIVDDVYIGTQCSNPTTTVSNITTSSAKISWPTGSASQWEVEVVNNQVAPTGQGVIVNQNFLNVTTTADGTPLQPGTIYKYYIRSVCSGIAGNYSDPTTFKTTLKGEKCQEPIVVSPTLPYISGNVNFYGSGGYSSSAGTGCGAGSSGYLNGNYTIYSYTPTANTSINIDVTGSQEKTAVFVYNSCSAIGVQCLASAVNDAQLEKKITNFAVSAGSTYYIVVATNQLPNTFSIVIRENCVSPPQASFTVSNCTFSTFDIGVNVTGFGGATSLLATVYDENGGVVSTLPINNLGVYTFGPFTAKRRIMLQSQQNPNCLAIGNWLSKDSCPPANDNCAAATSLTVSSNGNCSGISGRITGATISSEPNNCPGGYNDVWYQFTAINTEHTINISNVTGVGNTDLIHSLYKGTCGSLTQLYCSDSNLSTATGLEVGQVYAIRVSGKSQLPQEISFTICTSAFPTTCASTNPQSDNIVQLFKNLLNYLSTKPTTSTPFTCPQLTALAPFITDANPMIYNFVNQAGMLTFAFGPHPASNNDVTIYGSPTTPIAEINLLDYVNAATPSMLHLTYEDGSILNLRNSVSHINFCPTNTACNLYGKIKINPGGSCIVTGVKNVFSLQTTAGNITSYSWTFYDQNMNQVFASNDASPTVSFATAGKYLARLVVTTADGCSTKIERYFQVSATCTDEDGPGGDGDPSNNLCTLSGGQSETVKDLYIDLINHLLGVYNSGGTIPSPYTCTQLTALSQFVTDAPGAIYNTTYANGVLKFAFANHAAGDYDVILKNNGLVTDVHIATFTPASAAAGTTYSTTYINGIATDNHFIKHINFCPDSTGVCAQLTGNIGLNTGLTCILLNTAAGFNFTSTTNTITSYQWTFYNEDGINVLSSSDQSNPSLTYNNIGNYKVKLVVTYDSNCTATFYKLIKVNTICNECVETNPLTPVVKQAYLNLINHVYTIYANGGTIPYAYVCPESVAFAPYVTNNNNGNPAIYASMTNNKLQINYESFGITVFEANQVMTAPIADIQIDYNETTPYTYATAFAVLTNGSIISVKIASTNFCPDVPCSSLFGSITLGSGVSCIAVNTPQSFHLQGDTSGVVSYAWTFYNTTGTYAIASSSAASPFMTYTATGNYLVRLEIADSNGCKSAFYKTVSVSANCGSDDGNGNTGTTDGSKCTELNPEAATVRMLYTTFLNSLLAMDGNIPNGYTNGDLAALSPYITDMNPAVYNVTYTNNILSFSFSATDTQPDVVIKDSGTVVDINLVNYSAGGNPNYIVTYANGTQYTTHKAQHINFCPQTEPCESHVAFVFDESASMTETEVANIQIQLKAFVEQQVGSNMTVSFTGMADSDNYNRTDHIYGKITTANKNVFLSWIDNYKDAYGTKTGVSANSDYWLSGLTKAFTGYDLVPDIIIVIADGSQSAKVPELKQMFTQIKNSESHLYVYGIGNGFYVSDSALPVDPNSYTNTTISDVTPRLKLSLKFLMGLAPTEFPTAGNTDLLGSDYMDYTDFSHLSNDLRYFSDKLADANIGCGGASIPKDYCYDCETFQPAPGQVYWLSAWAKEEQNIQVKTYTNAVIKVIFQNQAETVVGELSFLPTGDIIDGWQRYATKFEIPELTTMMTIELINLSPSIPVYFDDIRVHPIQGSMKSFVYDPETFRLMAEQDDNNYSTFYEYDNEGGLVRIKKETSRGIKTIQESRSGSVIQTTN